MSTLESFEELFYQAFTEDRDAEAMADEQTLGQRCRKYAKLAAALVAEGQGAPSGYAYRYPDGIRFTGGESINGSAPIEAIPYYFGAAAPSLHKEGLPTEETLILREALQTIADFAVGHGDVCEIIAKRARHALTATPAALHKEGAPTLDAIALAKLFHETYERLAPKFGYETRRESALPWEEMPAKIRQLMIAVCQEIFPESALAGHKEGAGGAPFEFHKPGQIPVNAPTCDKCGKIFLDCRCGRIDVER